MGNISVGRYTPPTDEERQHWEAISPGVRFPADNYQGWIVPEEAARQWAGFVRVDGTLEVVLLDA